MDSTVNNNGAKNDHAGTDFVEGGIEVDAELVASVRIGMRKYRSEKRKMLNLKRTLRHLRLKRKRTLEALGIKEVETEDNYIEPEIEEECPELDMKEELRGLVEKYIKSEMKEECMTPEEFINNMTFPPMKAQESRKNSKKLQLESFVGKTNAELITLKKKNLIESSKRGQTSFRKRKLRQQRMRIKEELLEVRGLWAMEDQEEYIEPQIQDCLHLTIKEECLKSEIKEECIKSANKVKYMQPEIKEECIKSEIKEEYIKTEIKEECIKSENEEEYVELELKEDSIKSENMDQCLQSENKIEYMEPENKEECIQSERFITCDDSNYTESDLWYTQYTERSVSSNTPARIPVQIGNRPDKPFCLNCRKNYDKKALTKII